MKVVTHTLFIICISLFLTACSKEKDKKIFEIDNKQQDILYVENMDEKEFTYGDNNVLAFCVGEDGTVYTLEENHNAIRAYDTNGKYTKEYPIDMGMPSPYLDIDGYFIYYIFIDTLYMLSLSSGESTLLHQFEGDEFWFAGITAYEEFIFIIRKNQFDDEQADVRFDDNDVYVYEGEVLLRFDKSTKDVKAIDIPNVKLMTQKSDTELLIYAYDDEEGFYYTIYDVIKDELEEKFYTDLNFTNLSGIAYEDTLDSVIGMDMKGLFTTKLEDTSTKQYYYEMSQSANISQAIQYRNGYSYYCDHIDGYFKVVAIDNATFMKEKPILKAYFTQYLEMPNILGYQIEGKEVLESELATMLLAGDVDYDFIVIPSSYQLARNIREIGAYRPLDGVDGIDALLSQCYDYIDQASLDNQGRRWMLPIEVEVPVLIYNSKMSGEYGISPQDIISYEDLISTVVNLPTDGTIKYNIPYFYMTIDITNKYLSNYGVVDKKSFIDTDLFRKYVGIMTQYDTDVINGKKVFGEYVGYSHNPNESREEYYSKVLLQLNSSKGINFNDYSNDYFHATATPGLEEGKRLKSIVDCSFIVVNPNSKNKKWVEEYLSKLSQHIINGVDSFMLKDIDYGENRLKNEVQSIFANGEILFEYPYEIISDELTALRIEGKAIDEAISEMERKMDMYLNE